MSGPGRIRVWNRPHADALLEIAQRLLNVPRRVVTERLYRATYDRFLHLPDTPAPIPLYFNGSVAGRRYTPRGGPAGLYLSTDQLTPIAELQQLNIQLGQRSEIRHSTQSHAERREDPVIVISVDARLGRVLDVTDAATCSILDLRSAELNVDWERQQQEFLAGNAPMPPTQLLALAAHLTGEITAIMYTSVRTPFGTNIVVFPDRLGADDALEAIDSTGRLTQRLAAPASESA